MENTYHHHASSCTMRHHLQRPAPAGCVGAGGASGRRGTFVRRTARTGLLQGEGTEATLGGEQAV